MSLKIAFLDSGTGGVPYMQYFKQKCPNVSCVYLADAAHFPYGTKTAQEVADDATTCISLIINKWNPDAIVIACNTISVTALDILRKRFPTVPIVGTVPAIKLAAKLSKNRKIGVLATEGTVKQPYVKQLQKDFASDCEVFFRGDTELVAFVEHKLFLSSEQERLEAVKPAVDFFAKNNCDTIVLSCTHFVHLSSEIAKVAGQNVQVVDSREGVSRQAIKVVSELPTAKDDSNILSTLANFLADNPSDQALYVTGFPSENCIKEYKSLCSNLSIPWGGILQN